VNVNDFLTAQIVESASLRPSGTGLDDDDAEAAEEEPLQEAGHVAKRVGDNRPPTEGRQTKQLRS